MKELNLENKISELLINCIKRAVTRAPNDLMDILKGLKEDESSELAIEQLNLILDNFKYGKEKEVPVCQDTGVLNFFIELGSNFSIISNFQQVIRKAVIKASNLIPLRGNSVDPLTGNNPENNVGTNFPPVYLDIKDDADTLEVKVLAKGGGAENMSKLFMLNPSNGVEEIKGKIEQLVKDAGGMPCPPLILGVGIGGDATSCMNLAKKALLRPLNSRHDREDVAKLEKELIQRLNKLNIGIMGLGGKITCLDIHIEIAMRHPASYPVGVIVQCYSHRWASFKLSKKGEIIEEV